MYKCIKFLHFSNSINTKLPGFLHMIPSELTSVI